MTRRRSSDVLELPFIVGLGASTAIGRDAWSTAAAVRAGISGFTDHPYMIDTAGEAFRVALAPWLDIELPVVERLEALLFPAIDQAMQSPAMHSGDLRIAVALALPEPRPGLPEDLPHRMVAQLHRRAPGRFTSVGTFRQGHAAGLVALDAARGGLEQERFDACVVAGVDSYIDCDTLEWLEQNEQVHGAGRQNNAWGFIPGEGAAAFLLVRGSIADQYGEAPLAQLLGVGLADEPKAMRSGAICIGEGLTDAFRGALRSLPAHAKITDIYCDMNGEPYRADEFGFTCLRTKDHFECASDFVAPADCCGDLGAGGASLHVTLAAVAGYKAYAKGPAALVWSSGQQSTRAAAVLRVRSETEDAC